MPKAMTIPAKGEVAYQFIIIPTHFTEDRWVRMSEIRPGNRSVVHHAVAYIRGASDRSGCAGTPEGVMFGADDVKDPEMQKQALWTDDDLLLVYTPGAAPDRWPEGLAKLIPAGSDIVLQMHYTASGKVTTDRTSIGLVFAKQPPTKRVLTLQLNNDHFVIPPGVRELPRRGPYGSMSGTTRVLLSLYPHLHLRGKLIRIQHPRTGRTHEDAAARSALRFLLAVELQTGRADSTEGRHRAAGGCDVGQLEKQPA